MCTFSNIQIHPNTTAVINDRVKLLLECRNRDQEKKLGVKVFDGVDCALMLAAGLAMYRRYRNEWKEGEEH